MIQRRLPTLALLLSVQVIGGCADDAATPMTWNLRFEDATLIERIAKAEASVHKGGCGGEHWVYRAVLVPGERAPDLPPLEEGTYGFSAWARDAECRPIARGCVEVDLPLSTSVELWLEAVDEAPACGNELCDVGRCATDPPPILPDAGTTSSDGGSNGGPGLPSDSTRDAGSVPLPDGSLGEPLDAAGAEDAAALPDAGASGEDDSSLPIEDASTEPEDAGIEPIDADAPCRRPGKPCE